MSDDYERDGDVFHASPEQVKYANMLFWGSWLAIGIMLITYAIYVGGIIEPYIPLNEIPKYWSSPVHEYVEKAAMPVGWGWTSLLGKGDFLNFIGITILAAMTAVCFLITLLPAYIKQKDWIFMGIVILEALVLTLAASGILGSGGH